VDGDATYQALDIDARQCLGERHSIGEILNVTGILSKLNDLFQDDQRDEAGAPGF
jgi:hypothetical protein